MAKKPSQQSHASQRSVSSTPKASHPVPDSKPTPSSNLATSAPSPRPIPSSTSTSSGPTILNAKSSPQEVAQHVWNKYLNETPQRTLLLDAFMGFLVLVGAVQFLYCVLAGNYPFNAFLSGFCAAVGQFVLTVSLRMQTSERAPSTATSSSSSQYGSAKKSSTATTSKTIDGLTGEVIEEGGNGSSKYSSERAFADFVFGSLILHGFCVNFIN